MNAREMAHLLNSPAVYSPSHGIDFDVTISDVTQAWGKTRYLIQPISGQGEIWVEDSSLRLGGASYSLAMQTEKTRAVYEEWNKAEKYLQNNFDSNGHERF